MLWTRKFWEGAGERAIKSFAQALVVFVGAAGVGVLDVDWKTALSVSVAFALASVLTSIGNADFVAGSGERVELSVGRPAAPASSSSTPAAGDNPLIRPRRR